MYIFGMHKSKEVTIGKKVNPALILVGLGDNVKIIRKLQDTASSVILRFPFKFGHY